MIFWGYFSCFVVLLTLGVVFVIGKDSIIKKGVIKNLEIFVEQLRAELDKQKIDNQLLYNELSRHELLSRLVTQSPNGIMIMDRNCNVIQVNKGFEDMYEYSYEQFIKARGSNYRKTSFSAEVTNRINQIFKTRQPIKYEALNITKSGKELWTQTALVPILDKNGEVDGMVTIDTDIHKRIVAGDALIEKMENINGSVDIISNHFKRLTAETETLFETISQTNSFIDQTSLILGFVKDISDNLRILGINASIEAHIAGVNGLGFRVVSNEIVQISTRSLQYVSQITSILEKIAENQNQLLIEKGESATVLAEHYKQMQLLKKDIKVVEQAIDELKTLD